ncbi:NAD-dependent epimerase/dehydratase family protein [Mycobacterium sp. CVI_P3]|uniref:NAD-dependent epimerase/dehydratase family protein n=1 Tax=Mycobacterium pinniadriaticum TaxID=2994102 RepID=A0ABT3SBX3_9MYCO|nr:NAD-dependent epimerase/dehydratase family protein [Mycobacterium pinniadriaticum]MCX2930599.1 NAD-dependent epimerase/dehydratase family protein [Mycobacterium pinniadriaticum]MCX2937023.1 NAD-dependent epimerase/dehydratase family protein [Mycobacterium pinniadriaticum]
MRVLVTGASGVFGRVICRDLVRRGADVVALARRAVDIPGVSAITGDIRDADAVERAMRGCDSVIHLAFLLAPLRSSKGVEDINIGGMRNVLQAMDSTGTSHLVFTSSALAYGPWPDNPEAIAEDHPLRPHPDVLYARHKAICEELIHRSGVPAVITRTCVVAGRDMDNYEFRFLAHPLLVAPTGAMRPWQFLHTDDVGRFHAQAVLGNHTGIVNVGPRDTGITIDEIADILGKPLIRLPFGALRSGADAAWRADLLELSPADLDGFRYMPTLDTTRLLDEWGYTPVHDSRSALADARAGVRAVTYLGTAQIQVPWRTPMPNHRWTRDHRPNDDHCVDPAPPGLRGEFDDYIDDRYPTLTTANVGEAFGGTLTPMSLVVGRDALRLAGAIQVEVLDMRDPEVAAAQRTLSIASVGHRLYTNLSVVHAMAAAMPGTNAREVDEHILGIPHVPGEKVNRGSAFTAIRSALGVPNAVMRMAGTRGRIAEIADRVQAMRLSHRELRELDANALMTLIDAARETTLDAWAYSTTTNLVASAAQALVRKVAPDIGLASMRGGPDGLASAALLAGVRHLVGLARARPHVELILRTEPAEDLIKRLDDVAPIFDAAFRKLIVDAGHRGPGETELANSMYSDRPEQLIHVVRKALDVPTRPNSLPPELSGVARRAVGLLNGAVRRRERSKDVAMRSTHLLRLALREIGRRQVDAGVFGEVGDVFYLTPEEIAVPELFAHRVADRRAERGRLSALQLPPMFTLNWEPLNTMDDSGSVDGVLAGIGASPGIARGPVRVVHSTDEVDDIEAGAVLVVHVTDVGWTPLFGCVAAVVTDVGGLHSHAAIVAREFGVPCVVGTSSATLDLHDGAVVEVDGTRGTVTYVGRHRYSEPPSTLNSTPFT